MAVFEVEGEIYKIELVYKVNNKRFILRYKQDHYVMSCPIRASFNDIEIALNKIGKNRIEQLRKRHKETIGEDFIYLFGSRYQLKYRNYSRYTYTIANGEIRLYGSNKQTTIERFLKEQLYQYCFSRMQDFHKLGYVKFMPDIEIKKMKSVHGICYHQKRLVKFSLHLIYQPKSVIDSIIIHEIGHFYFPNHSADFYNWVYVHDKNYKESMKYLKQGGAGDDPINQ